MSTLHNSDTFRTLFVENPMPMWLYDQKSLRFIEANDAAQKKYGYSRDEFLQMTIADIRPPEDVERLHEALRNRPNIQGYRRMAGWRHRRKDGSLIWVDVYSTDFRYGDHTVRLVMAHDVTDLKRASEAIREQSGYFRQLFESSPEAIVMLDREDAVVETNQAFQALFGYAADEVRGRRINEVIVPQERAEEATLMSLSVLGNAAVQRDTVRRRKDGLLVEVSVLGYPIKTNGEQVGVFAIYRDITESRRIAAQLAYHSTHDPLTGLYNRHEFERLTHVLLKSATAERRHALLFVDLDQFKVVNESLGHDAGDQVLLEAAEVIRAQLRDHQHDIMGRVGGDKFGLLLRNCDAQEAALVARRIVDTVRDHRFRWRDRTLTLGLSVGLVEMGAWKQNLTELVSAADTACMAAKDGGRGRVHVYRPDDEELLRQRGVLSWASRITEAIEGDKFALYFQRIVPVMSPGSVASRYEVLLRLQDADRPIALPGLFISAAERYGLMPTVDRHVISRVLERLQQRAARQRPLPDLLSVNVSGTSISEEGFSGFIREQIARREVPPQVLCFEITETAAIANLSRALGFIRDMREYGCSVALDDFGSGMSSFNYLKSLAVDYLKIDGGFIRDIVRNPLDCAMAEAINKVGQVKGIKTVAEFVEDAATLAKLRDMGVDYAQGFYIHHPEPWEQPTAATLQ